MLTLGRFCLLVSVHSVLDLYQRFLRISLGFLLMDFASTFKFLTQAGELGCGFVLLGYFSRFLNIVGFILIFGFCLKILHSGWNPKEDLMQFLCAFGGTTRSSQVSGAKVATLKRDTHKSSSQNPNSAKKKKKSSVAKGQANSNSEDVLEDKDENEDEVFDVMTLRKMVKIQRQRLNAAYAEIEKERTAASSAAEEAMAMILRLQTEKSSVEIQANQFRRMVEQKQEYDQEVIEQLEWIINQHESQRSLLEEQLEIYGDKLRQFMRDDEIDQLGGNGLNCSDMNCYDEYDDDLDGSLEKDSHTDLVSAEGC